MKKLTAAITVTLSIIALVFISISSCKKEAKKQIGFKLKKEVEIRSLSSPGGTDLNFDSISITGYNFLKFSRISDIEEYRKFIERSTHSQVQDYLHGIGFSSLGAAMYSYNNDTVTHEQAINYVFNSDGIFQTGSVIMKPVEKGICSEGWRFLLTMTEGNLNSSSYDDLASGTYDSNTMDKFATNPLSDPETDLFDFIQGTATGHEETTPNLCPNYQSAKPFWGWDNGSCVNVHHWNPEKGEDELSGYSCEPSYYIFWIRVRRGTCTAMDAPCPQE